jgi:cytoskeletal protein RodZ
VAENIGDLISSARKEAGLTLHNLAEKTRIREKLISDIESNNFPNGHIPTYTRGHILLLAKDLGIPKSDLDDVLSRYEKVKERPMHDLLSENNITPINGRKNKFKLSYPVLGFFAVLIILGMVLIPTFSNHKGAKIDAITINSPAKTGTSNSSSQSQNGGGKNGSSTSGSSSTSATDLTGESSTATPGTSITTSIPSGPILDNSTITSTGARIVSLTILGTSTKSWISVASSAGEMLYQGIILEGHHSTFSDGKSLDVHIGNAAGVNLTLNGKDLGAPGASGAVLHLTFLSDPNGK